MIANAGKLAGQTVFITGASRGIGKAIAEKCARDGANIVIAAKTVEPHSKLSGTIFSAAEEVKKYGGECLPCQVDIRDEAQVVHAVEKAVKTFGGIDILVNNASAISLTNTDATKMKKFDLMFGVNVRGTYLCSKYCIPHLRKGKNSKILNISPPLNMSSDWFKGHCAYTMAKYGMSMCVLGMAEEFRSDSVSVNALWPKTAIYTAAMEMLVGGNAQNLCRKPEIMSDAAYVILTDDQPSNTGKFYIDEEILTQAGVTDFSSYNYTENPSLLPDFFLDTSSEKIKDFILDGEVSSKISYTETQFSVSNVGLMETLKSISKIVNADLVQDMNASYLFDLKDEGLILLDLKSGSGSLNFHSTHRPLESDATLILNADDFCKMFKGELQPTFAYMSGKLKIKGDLGKAMKLEKILKSLKPV